MTAINAQLTNLALAPMTGEAEAKAKNAKNGGGSWFEAMAAAWGATLDSQAAKIEELSAGLEGNDSPSAITELSAASMKFSFMSTSANTAISSVNEGLGAVARK